MDKGVVAPRSAGVLDKMSNTTLSVVVYSLTLVVILLVAILIAFPQMLAVTSADVSFLPKLNAMINTSCTILLFTGYVLIRQRKIAAHRVAMLSAFFLSCIFLLSYVFYHSHAPSTSFGGEGMIRYVYFFILITHIVLAAIIVPLALFTIARAWRSEFPLHKKIARITLPIWIYVTVTGVIVYLMISPYYAFN